MLGSTDLVAFVPVTDLDRARQFYEGMLELELVADTPVALVFDACGTPLRINRVPEPPRLGFTIVGWIVDDMYDTLHWLSERGVPAVVFDGIEHDEHGVWTAPSGDLLAWFRDPDGNTISLTQAHLPPA
jgi:catechol 2,3-dioxygenase-like lactoylglutathione lyase family enzyme